MNFFTVTMKLLGGFGLSCIIFFLTLIIAMPLGLVISFGSMSRFAPLRWLTKTFVWVIRGTPLMLQLMVVYFGPGLIFGWTAFPKMNAVLIAFIINYAAYFSEIYRSGIEGVPRGQYEAGQVLGMTGTQVFFKVILLQVIKRIVPPMANEIITLVKDTSLARVIAVMEIIMVAHTFTAKGLIWPLFYAGAFYLLFCGVLTLLFGYIERKLSYFRV
ncbi:MAG: amino acid ABC transporter permease [Clostridiales bacterium]|nr:amino acid ABC transporter permease [Clostridiales bacterium]